MPFSGKIVIDFERDRRFTMGMRSKHRKIFGSQLNLRDQLGLQFVYLQMTVSDYIDAESKG